MMFQPAPCGSAYGSRNAVSRDFWYACRNPQMSGNAASPAATSDASCHGRAPARYAIPKKIPTKTRLVPRSGCRYTSANAGAEQHERAGEDEAGDVEGDPQAGWLRRAWHELAQQGVKREDRDRSVAYIGEVVGEAPGAVMGVLHDAQVPICIDRIEEDAGVAFPREGRAGGERRTGG